MKPGRESEGEIIFYKSVGIAIQEVATATLVYHKTLDRKIGTHVEIQLSESMLRERLHR